MELACTKNLLEYIGIKPPKVSTEIEPLFAWSANLIVVNRRKTLVVTNEASRCAFVLYGLTAKSRAKLPELILDGIRAVLESEYVRPDIIEQYLTQLGQEVSFGANTSRKAVARCNKVCERVKMFPDLLKPEELLQRSILPWLNDDVVSGDRYIMAYASLIGQLQERFGDGVQSCRGLELQVSLELHTPCKRRIVVPDDLNFYQFHHVLQYCFGWRGCHLHQFVIEVDDAGYPTKIIQPDWIEETIPQVQVQNSMEVTLRDVFASQKQIVYEYDFGDGWLHSIELCRVIEDCKKTYPHCVLAVGDAPMENCGGPDGFHHVMKVLEDPKHPEHQEISRWVKEIWWKPLDVQLLNRTVKYAHRKVNLPWRNAF